MEHHSTIRRPERRGYVEFDFVPTPNGLPGQLSLAGVLQTPPLSAPAILTNDCSPVKVPLWMHDQMTSYLLAAQDAIITYFATNLKANMPKTVAPYPNRPVKEPDRRINGVRYHTLNGCMRYVHECCTYMIYHYEFHTRVKFDSLQQPAAKYPEPVMAVEVPPQVPTMPLHFLTAPYLSAAGKGEMFHAGELMKFSEESFRHHQVCKAVSVLLNRGMHVYSSIAHNAAILQSMGVANSRWDGWHKFELAMIDRSDVLLVLMLPGWEESEIVQIHIGYAKARNKTIKYYNQHEFD